MAQQTTGGHRDLQTESAQWADSAKILHTGDHSTDSSTVTTERKRIILQRKLCIYYTNTSNIVYKVQDLYYAMFKNPMSAVAALL